MIIFVLLDGPMRARDLENRISGLSQKVLLQQLRSLEEHGLVYRQTFAEEPKRVDYGLTALGMSLKPIISQLDEWGTLHAEEREETVRLLPCEAVVRGAVDAGRRLAPDQDDGAIARRVVTTGTRESPEN